GISTSRLSRQGSRARYAGDFNEADHPRDADGKFGGGGGGGEPGPLVKGGDKKLPPVPEKPAAPPAPLGSTGTRKPGLPPVPGDAGTHSFKVTMNDGSVHDIKAPSK